MARQLESVEAKFTLGRAADGTFTKALKVVATVSNPPVKPASFEVSMPYDGKASVDDFLARVLSDVSKIQ